MYAIIEDGGRQHKVTSGDTILIDRQVGENEKSVTFDRVLLVGHQPDMSELASFLLTGNHNLNIEFKKGGLCGIQVASIPPRGPGLLRMLLAPRHMRGMGK